MKHSAANDFTAILNYEEKSKKEMQIIWKMYGEFCFDIEIL
jgi:hypothetical protein